MKFPNQYRWHNAPHGYRSSDPDPFGLFRIPQNGRQRALKIMADDGEDSGWEHVSVSLMESANRCPSWEEMCLVKSLFWDDEETVIQFHPPKSEYVSFHAGCLHLWKCVSQPFPLPPSILVGPKT